MRIRIIVTIAILGITPCLVFSQENPTDITTIEQQPQETSKQQQVSNTETPTAPTEQKENVTETPFPEKPSPVETVAPQKPTTEPVEITTEPTKTEMPTEPSFAKAMADMPEPVKEEPVVIPEEPEKEGKPLGIDTMSLENPQGNWL